MHFFGFERVAFSFAVFMLIYLLVAIFKKHDLKEISTPLIYFCFVVIAYLFSSMEFVKLIPALISASFFVIFITAYLHKRGLILKITKKFYNKMDVKKERFLAASDGYWAFVILINTFIQVGLVFYDNNELWAFYSSIGWYVLMFIALISQVGYGKLSNRA
jgi:hypothetical protein